MKYSVDVDVTYSVNVKVEASSPEEAKRIAETMDYESMQNHFVYHIGSKATECEEIDRWMKE